MGKIKKFLLPTYIICSCISLILVVGFIVINYCFEKPKTSGYEYFSSIKVDSFDVEDSLTVNELPIIELNICESETNPNLNLYEMVITEYTDYNHTTYKRYGMQIVGDFGYWTPKGKYFNVEYNVSHSVIRPITSNNTVWSDDLYSLGLYFYEIDNTGSVFHSTDYKLFEEYLDDLDVVAGSNNFKLEVGGDDGMYSYSHDYRKDIALWGLLSITETGTYYNEYTSLDLFHYLIRGFDNQTGTTTIATYFNNLDLDNYFTILKGNDKNQYYTLDDVFTNNAYFTIKVNHKDISTNLTVSDSIIGKINGESNYSSGVTQTKTPYYSTSVDLTLTGYDFTYLENTDLDINVLTLSDSFRSYLLSLNHLNLDININLDKFDSVENISGINLNSLGTLKIGTLKITISSPKDFYVLNSARFISVYDFDSSLTLKNNVGGVWSE